MFGWLAARITPPCRHAPQALLSRRTLRIEPRVLCQQLPALGNVLYLHSGLYPADARGWLPPRVVAAQRAFAPLLDTRWLIATSVVTDDGPREWIDCLDQFGRPCARLHLLPDTDYLGWDALLHAGEVQPLPPHFAAELPCWRPDQAQVLAFSLRPLGGLQLLSREHTPLSPLGGHVATRIARAEALALH